MKKKLLSLLAVTMMALTSAFAQADNDYLCFTAVEAGAVIDMQTQDGSGSSLSLETSTDGTNWTNFKVDVTSITLQNVGDKVYFRNTSNTTSFSTYSFPTVNYYRFSIYNAKVAASGNVMSLMDKNCPTEFTNLNDAAWAFYNLFMGCSKLTTAPTLPATTLPENCYNGMFFGCSNLVNAPTLPATTLANGCYNTMFNQCSALKNITVGFSSWPASNCTDNWMADVTGSSFTFYCPNGLEETIGDSNIPNGATIVKYNKSIRLNSKGYGTFSAADKMEIIDNGTAAKAYKAGVSGNTITLTELSGAIPAGHGVLLNAAKPYDMVILKNSTSNNADMAGNNLKATTKADGSLVAKPSGYTYVLGTGDEFLSYTGAAFIHNRAYFNFESSKSVKMEIVFDDESTAINDLRANDKANRKMLENGRVVIMKNGRKYNVAGQPIK